MSAITSNDVSVRMWLPTSGGACKTDIVVMRRRAADGADVREISMYSHSGDTVAMTISGGEFNDLLDCLEAMRSKPRERNDGPHTITYTNPAITGSPEELREIFEGKDEGEDPYPMCETAIELATSAVVRLVNLMRKSVAPHTFEKALRILRKHEWTDGVKFYDIAMSPTMWSEVDGLRSRICEMERCRVEKQNQNKESEMKHELTSTDIHMLKHGRQVVIGQTDNGHDITIECAPHLQKMLQRLEDGDPIAAFRARPMEMMDAAETHTLLERLGLADMGGRAECWKSVGGKFRLKVPSGDRMWWGSAPPSVAGSAAAPTSRGCRGPAGR